MIGGNQFAGLFKLTADHAAVPHEILIGLSRDHIGVEDRGGDFSSGGEFHRDAGGVAAQPHHDRRFALRQNAVHQITRVAISAKEFQNVREPRRDDRLGYEFKARRLENNTVDFAHRAEKQGFASGRTLRSASATAMPDKMAPRAATGQNDRRWF